MDGRIGEDDRRAEDFHLTTAVIGDVDFVAAGVDGNAVAIGDAAKTTDRFGGGVELGDLAAFIDVDVTFGVDGDAVGAVEESIGWQELMQAPDGFELKRATGGGDVEVAGWGDGDSGWGTDSGRRRAGRRRRRWVRRGR